MIKNSGFVMGDKINCSADEKERIPDQFSEAGKITPHDASFKNCDKLLTSLTNDKSVRSEVLGSELKVPDLEGGSHNNLFYSSDVTFLDSSPILSYAPTPSSTHPVLSPIPADLIESSTLESTPQTPDSSTTNKTKRKSKSLIKPAFNQIRKQAMSRDELKQCGNLLKELKRHPDSAPFLQPVNHVKLQIPDYPHIVKNPMDFNTIENKLLFCAYKSVDDIFQDIERIFQNCYLYNGVAARVSIMASQLESYYKELKDNFRYDSELSEKSSTIPSRRTSMHSTAGSTIKSTTKVTKSSKTNSRKPSYANYQVASPLSIETTTPPGLTEAQRNLCHDIIFELLDEKHLVYSSPFLEPVDWKELGLLDYPTIISHPMDLSTIKSKLKRGLYHSLFDFESDIRLMFSNCFKYNSPNNPVHKSGRKLEKVFEKKWLPDFDDASVMSDHSIREHSEKPVKKSRKSTTPRKKSITSLPKSRATPPQVTPMSPLATSKRRPSKVASPKPKKSSKRSEPPTLAEPAKKVFIKINIPAPPAPEMSYNQKLQLTHAISELNKKDVLVALDIIRLSNPDLQQSQGEIQIELDSLDNSTLVKLYDYVMSKTEIKKPKKVTKSRSAPTQPRKVSTLPTPKSMYESSKNHKTSKAGTSKSMYPALKKAATPSSSSSSSSSSSGSDSDSSGYSSSSG